ncbi:MAG: cytochrome c [Ancalomicrobiaceae bacterium]|nr:cytochrome c [Ancalomicrobiaceae bacterium]
MKRLGILLLVVVLAGAGAAYWYATRTPSSPFDAAANVGPPTPLDRSEYVARLADCIACHSTSDGAPFAGGLKMGTPLGAIYSTNITPDRETGIGTYTLAQFDNAVRRGVAADGHRLYPAMPFPSYAKMSDADVKALYDYFMTHVQPVKQLNRTSEIRWPLDMRWPLAFWSGIYAGSDPFKPDAGKDELWNRGAYLVEGPGHCGSCHTPRGVAFDEVALDDGSSHYLGGAGLDGWYAPSLRGEQSIGLGRWSEADIVAFLKHGRNAHGVVFGSMTDAYNNSTQFMSDADLAAIAHYLKALPADPSRADRPWAYDAEAARTAAIGTTPAAAGARIFTARCSFCHGQDGRGQGQWLSPLAGTSSALAADSASMVNVVLNGSDRVVSGGVPDAYRMPPFRAQLSDAEIADMLTFVRSAWGNASTPVTADQVKDLRERSRPASSEAIVLQMR